MNRIGIYGGAFDPIHNDHIRAIMTALLSGQFDAIWVMPCWDHAFGKKMQPYGVRLLLADLAIHSIFNPLWVSVSDLERSVQSKYTIELAEYLRKEDPTNQHTFIIGQDNWDIRESWHRWDELSKLAGFYVVPRTPLSSTEIRGRLAKGEDCQGLVPPVSLASILKHGLYRETP